MSSTTSQTFDVVVIGGGPAGENIADRAVAGGLTAVIVESELVGGECSYWACDPSKALLRPGLLHAEIGAVPGLAKSASVPLDVDAVLAHRDRMASNWDDAPQVEWLRGAGIELIRGVGRLAGTRAVTVATPEGQTVHLAARHAVVVCTGTRASLPPLPGLEELKPWTSREATSAPTVPRRLAVLGAGVVAVEMATAWRALGSEVTLIAREAGLLPRVEPFAAELVADRMREVGIELRFESGISRAVRNAGGEVEIELVDGSRVVADELLLATGRVARTEDLGLESVGLKPGDWLYTDDLFAVKGVGGGGESEGDVGGVGGSGSGGGGEGEGDWLYAVGDVNRRALLTHQGKYQARIAGGVIVDRAHGRRLDIRRWGRHVGTADREAVPQVVFTDPEIASVGLTVAEAERDGRVVDVVDYQIGRVAGAVEYRPDYKGQARILVDPARGVVVGATFVGANVAELLYSATVVISGEVPLDRLWHAVPAFPTISEVWLRLLETYRDSTAGGPNS